MTASWRASWPALVASTAARIVLGALTLLLAVSVLLPLVAGWQSSVVMSGSMAPTLTPGDLVLVRFVEAATLEPGDIVLVDDPDVPGELRVHRLVAVEPGGLRLRGDASPQADTSLVDPAAVHGVGTVRLPALGRPALWAAEGRVAPLVLTGLAVAGLLVLALLHKAPAETTRPGRRSARRVALGAAVLALAGLPGVADARAVFTATTSTPASGFTAAPYWTCAAAVAGAGATQYYPLQETAGTVATNSGSLGAAANATYSGTGLTYGRPGPECSGTARSAVALNGSTGQIWTARAVTNPRSFSIQVWFATTTTRGGKLIGFGNGVNGAPSADYDRHVYMTNSGQLVFGVYDGAPQVITSPRSYNDGRWHLATATFAPAPGMRLYVDGVQVAKDTTVSAAQNYTGYWRLGHDSLAGWPAAPTSTWFAGSLAHAAVVPGALPEPEVGEQYGAGPWTCATAAGPAGAAAVHYYGLQEGAGPTAGNGGSAGAAGNATYAGGVTYGVPGPACGPGGSAAVRLDGASGHIWTSRLVADPQELSVQIWFATTTARGGKLIGFGTGADGAGSVHYDRHIYMTDAGRLVFGVYDGANQAVTSPAGYNDGRWHLATATFSPGTGMALYVDGTLVGQNRAPTAAEHYSGYWRIGFDTLAHWPAAPTSDFFAGSVAHASVYDRVLPADEVAGQYAAGR